MTMPTKRYHTAARIEEERLAPGDEKAARADAARIASHLRKRYGARSHGIGSLFEDLRPFRSNSDIDLVVRGLPKPEFFHILAEIDGMTDFEVNIIPWEDANSLVRDIVSRSGVPL